jgi:hypothetical protein
MVDIHTGRSGGEPMREKMVSLLCLVRKHAGHACLFQGPVWPLANGQYVQSRAWWEFWVL